ncbi:MAG: saccharopine dehydrogenase NADP-binding domain-containing protein [Flavobacteriales bacterium]|nr:saccharopine dehydrogenase NADP-binding domain-containing protein [Flavobacteriales bacterium]
MKHILLIGAGRSTGSLVKYLIDNAKENSWDLKIADRNFDFINASYFDLEYVNKIEFDVTNETQRKELIKSSDIVISMLPAHMHIDVAKDCIAYQKHMVTASYISPEMKALEAEAKAAGVIIINEIGVDPGIDHLSAKKVIDEIIEEGGELKDFETFTGGLVAPEHDNNPWNYKFTWNPRNVVLAGQGGTVKFKQEGTYKYIPYNKVFRRTELIDIDGYGRFEGYANRDSLKYRKVYDLENISTMFRGTLRRPGYCRAWDAFVELGATDDSYTLANSKNLTFRSFINLFLPYNPSDSVELKFMHYLNIAHDDIELFEKYEWLDLFKDVPVELDNATPAQILQKILMRKWTLAEEDKDMIVMWHKFIYLKDNKLHERHSSMVVKGEDQTHTAMAKTVGLPVGITTKMILNGKIAEPGVHIPIKKAIYEPILSELEDYGIIFNEKNIT